VVVAAIVVAVVVGAEDFDDDEHAPTPSVTTTPIINIVPARLRTQFVVTSPAVCYVGDPRPTDTAKSATRTGPGSEETVSANDNVKVIQSVYEAFGRGDVAAILEVVTEDVDWASEAADPSGAPWFGVHHGRDGVAAFFEEFGSTMEVEEFTPAVFAASDNDVLTVVHYQARSRATGRSISMDLHHWFSLRDGKITYYRGTEDTAQTVAALRG
jgi:ketosteroid isomerase-like protein